MTDSPGRRFVRALERAAVQLGDRRSNAALSLATAFGIRGYVVRHAPAPPARDPATMLAGVIERGLLDAAAEISDELDHHGIVHFFVKGIALAGRLYRSGDREMADIDLHVPPESRAATRAVLIDQLGYQPLADAEQGAPEVMRSGVALERPAVTASGLDHVAVDLRWGLDPVYRLLPRADAPVPSRVWQSLDRSDLLPVPADAHHIVLIVHHLVHHDLLHVRGLLDLMLLWERLDAEAGSEMECLAADLGVLRALRLLAHMMSEWFDMEPCGVAPCSGGLRTRRAYRLLDPVAWCVRAARAPEAEFVEVTLRRIGRRVVLLDRLSSIRTLLEDALRPPAAYLTWRWPEAGSVGGARLKHLGRVIGKSLGSPG